MYAFHFKIIEPTCLYIGTSQLEIPRSVLRTNTAYQLPTPPEMRLKLLKLLQNHDNKEALAIKG